MKIITANRPFTGISLSPAVRNRQGNGERLLLGEDDLEPEPVRQVWDSLEAVPDHAFIDTK